MILRCPECHAKNRIPETRLLEGPRCGKCKAPIRPDEVPFPVESAADFDELVKNAPVPVLVDFWAAWCGPCRMVAPELEKLLKTLRGGLLVAKLDTDAVPEIAQRFGIRSIPTMILFRGGAEARRVSGAMRAPELAERLGLGGPRASV